MSYQVLQNTWIGVTSEPVHSIENYYNCGSSPTSYVGSCKNEADKKHCNHYYKMESSPVGVNYTVPCMKKPNKNQCKADTGSKFTDAEYTPFSKATNICGSATDVGDEMHICGEPCDPYTHFRSTNKCSNFSGFNGWDEITNCLKHYKTENATSPAPYNVYCYTKIKSTGEAAGWGEFKCIPDDKRMNPSLAPAAAPV